MKDAFEALQVRCRATVELDDAKALPELQLVTQEGKRLGVRIIYGGPSGMTRISIDMERADQDDQILGRRSEEIEELLRCVMAEKYGFTSES